MKTQLTQQDIERLDAARGLDLNSHLKDRRYANTRGLRPSVANYNTAVKTGIYLGAPIIPIG